jgi:outer membrane beta-barrel protein
MRLAIAVTVAVTLLASVVYAQQPPAAKAETDPRFWQQRRQVGVVQKRKYPKARAFELAAYAGVIPNDAFVVHLPIGARFTHHLSERFAWEASASFTLDVDTALRSFLMDEDANLSAQVRDRQRARFDAGILWSPLYGKLAWLNSSVIYVDVFASAGGGAVYTAADDIGRDASVRPELYLGLGMRVFLSRALSLRLEYRQLAYLRVDDPSGESGGLATPSELSIGVGWLFGGGGPRK